ncbi:hypothetical protein ACEN88_03720 [Massilia sp. CT11-108]|uniref:hypothetical protein n=1 Tax=Massilia sp. CT11-108 TaxID=3393900 RepID=UPI0039A4FA59
MTRKIYVVDQNVMRSPRFAEFVDAHPNAKFVIPDTGLVEMVKNEHWEDTFRNSFEAFVPLVTRCFMAMSIQEARELEIRSRASAEGRLLPSIFTELLRGAIVESQIGSGQTMSLLRDRMAEAREDLQRHDLNVEANRDELKRLVGKLRAELSEDGIKACRQGGIAGRIARLGIARAVGDGFYVAHMKKAGVPNSVSRRLWKTKSLTRRWCYVQVHHALQWLGDGGLDTAKGKVVLNDILDQDYVLLGSAFDGVLSLETDVRKALEDLQFMLSLPPSAHAPVIVR